jgi:hypothetical protein
MSSVYIINITLKLLWYIHSLASQTCKLFIAVPSNGLGNFADGIETHVKTQTHLQFEDSVTRLGFLGTGKQNTYAAYTSRKQHRTTLMQKGKKIRSRIVS